MFFNFATHHWKVSCGMVALLFMLAATPAEASILLNFGTTINDNTNSAMHEDGGVVGTTWNLIGTADVAGGIVDDQGNATGVSINLGSGAASGYTMDWSAQPGSAAALGSVFKTGIYADNGHSATYTANGLELGVRISGLAAGVYDLYFSGRNTNASGAVSHRYYYEVVDSASGNTTYSQDNSFVITYQSSTDFLADTPNTWDKDLDYGVVRYTIADGEDIVLVASTRGFIATMGIIEVPEPTSMMLVVTGALALLRNRRK